VAELLLDTDVFVDHLRGARRMRPGRHRLHYSVVTRCELFAGRGADEELLRLLLAPFRELPVDREVAERAGRIRRETGATALEHRLTLVTRNLRDFQPVRGLRLSAPERILPAR